MGARFNFIQAVDQAESYAAAHPDQHEAIARLMGEAVVAARRLLDAETYVAPVPDSLFCRSLETSENDDSPEEREMTRQGVGDFGDEGETHELLNGASDVRKAACSCGEGFSTTTEAVQHRTTEEERARVARAAADLGVAAA